MSITDFIYNPKTGLYSADKLLRKLKDDGYNITLSELNDMLNSQYFYQVNKSERKPKKFNTIYSTGVFKSCQMDIIDYSRYEYNKYKYIFCFIDVYSRYGWAFPLTNHRTETIISKLQQICDEVGEYPQNINCDLEFDTNEMKKFAHMHNINFYFSEPYDIVKNSIVERWNRTLNGLLQKYRTASNKYDWYKYINDIVYNYNHTYHRTIKDLPINIFEGDSQNYQPIYNVKNKFKVGDKVRTIIHKDAFTKGDVKTYSNDVYIIEKIMGNKIYLDGIRKSFKPYELQLTKNIVFWNDDNEEEERIHMDNQRIRKDKRLLNKLDLERENILTDKRKRTQKKRNDDFEYF